MPDATWHDETRQSRAGRVLAFGGTRGHPARDRDAAPLKRRAIERLLRDEEWSKWSNRKIAKAAGVDHKTVEKVRRELLGGDFPTPTRSNGEIPRTNGMPNSASGSAVKDLLRTIPIEELIEECERRGLKVEATDA